MFDCELYKARNGVCIWGTDTGQIFATLPGAQDTSMAIEITANSEIMDQVAALVLSVFAEPSNE